MPNLPNQYYTDNYDTWNSVISKTESSNIINTRKTFIDLECFKQLKHFMLAPGCIYNDQTYISNTHQFDTEQDIIDFIQHFKNFKLYKCLLATTDNQQYFILRGSP